MQSDTCSPSIGATGISVFKKSLGKCQSTSVATYNDVSLRKPKLFAGKVTLRFLEDMNDPTISLELDCLKPVVKSNTMQLEEIPPHLSCDIGYLIFGM